MGYVKPKPSAVYYKKIRKKLLLVSDERSAIRRDSNSSSLSFRQTKCKLSAAVLKYFLFDLSVDFIASVFHRVEKRITQIQISKRCIKYYIIIITEKQHLFSPRIFLPRKNHHHQHSSNSKHLFHLAELLFRNNLYVSQYKRTP